MKREENAVPITSLFPWGKSYAVLDSQYDAGAYAVSVKPGSQYEAGAYVVSVKPGSQYEAGAYVVSVKPGSQ